MSSHDEPIRSAGPRRRHDRQRPARRASDPQDLTQSRRAPSATDGMSSGVTHGLAAHRGFDPADLSVAAWRSWRAVPNLTRVSAAVAPKELGVGRGVERDARPGQPGVGEHPGDVSRLAAGSRRRTALASTSPANGLPTNDTAPSCCSSVSRSSARPMVTTAPATSTWIAYERSPASAPRPRRCPIVMSSTASTAPTSCPSVSTTRPGCSDMRSPRNSRRPPALVMKHTSWLSGLAAVRRPSAMAR